MQVFRSSDVVVWNGIVCTYSTAKPFVEESDLIRLADRQEVNKYLKIK
jgi:hypothetical protein